MTTAIVAARAGSARLPDKALLPFGECSTLIGHKVRQLMACREIDRVVVNSDGPAIVAAAVAAGAEPIVGRDYAGDTREMLADSARQVSPGLVVWAHPTNPLVRSETYAAAIRAYRQKLTDGFDSLVSVYRVQRHAWLNGGPVNYNPWGHVHPLAADVLPVLFQDGAIFIQDRSDFLSRRYFFGARPYLFEVPADEVGDIDARQDYDHCTRTQARSPLVETAVPSNGRVPSHGMTLPSSLKVTAWPAKS